MFGTKKVERKKSEMTYVKEHSFDEKVIDRINDYIEDNMLSASMIAKKAGMSYNQMYQILHKNQLIKLREYVMLCDALGVGLDQFVRDCKAEPVKEKNAKDLFEPW